MGALQPYNTVSEALQSIPDQAKFHARVKSGGRPSHILNGDSPDWTKKEFQAALLDGQIPAGEIVLKPLLPTGKVSATGVKFDLSLSSQSFNLESGGGGAPDPSLSSPHHIQTEVVAALLKNMDDERKEVWSLRETVDELRQENLDLKLEIQALKHRADSVEKDDSVNGLINRMLPELLKGPFGAIVANKFLNPTMANAVTDAARNAVSPQIDVNPA